MLYSPMIAKGKFRGKRHKYMKTILIKDTEYIITESYANKLDLKDIIIQILWSQYQSDNKLKKEA